MIRLVNVNKYYNKKKSNQIHVINDTSLQLEGTGLVTFLGPSGCGKTTLLNAIGGLDKVDSGEVFIGEDKITCRSNNKKDEIRNAKVGYIFQNYNLLEDATVYENVALVLKMMGVKDKAQIEERVMFVLKSVGIDRYRNRPAKMLSGGERQRVGIARAIVKNPQIIIADEPTGNLDSRNTIEIMNIIKAISREKLVILVTHERQLAEFYASRIIEIVDGRIVGDKDNAHDGTLDYHMENKVFLKDMPVQKELESDGIRVKFFSDTPEDLEVKVVVRNGHLYIETEPHITEGSAAMELIDDHYQEISKDIYEAYEFDYGRIAGSNDMVKYTSIFHPIALLKSGFKRVASYSVLKKILLAGFVMASMFVIYAVSNVGGVTNITDDEFVTANQNYLVANTGKVTPKMYDYYVEMEGIDYVLPGDGAVVFTFSMDDYYQSNEASCEMKGSLSAMNLLEEGSLLYGETGTKERQLVIDKMVVDTMLESFMPQQIGLKEYKDFVGRTASIEGLGEFTITGITDQGSPSIYSAKSMMMPILQCQTQDGATEDEYMEEDLETESTGASVTSYDLVADTDEIIIDYGEAPDEPYEALVSLDLQYEVFIGGTIDTKVNGQKLTVCGFYTSKRGETDKIYVDAGTAAYHFMGSQKHLTLSPVDKQATLEQLADSEIKITDTYTMAKEEYEKSIRSQILAAIWVAAVMLLISLVEMYLMLRASFLSRIKEVGVLRAIGLKKRDIYKMFLGEIIALTTVTTLPGMAIMAYILNGVSQIAYIGESYMMNPVIFGISIGLVFGFNLLAGLLPVFSTLRKSPAEILARNDVN